VPKELRNTEIDDGELARVEAIIHSMTLEERRNPDLIDGSRRLRIANGSGSGPSEVTALLQQFREMQKMMKQFAPMTAKRKQKKNNTKAKKGGRTTARGAPKVAAPQLARSEFKLPGLN
jgi:signal recognition particle subunit SRP54